jgi:putative two-component system response regulator
VAAGRILVVDDTPANLALVERILTSEGYAVQQASDGAEAIRLVATSPPDLVLMDVMMPHVNGFEACRVLKQDAATRLIPIVLITALQDSKDRIAGIEAGADDFLTKPVNVHELRARVRSLLRIKRYTDDLDSAESVIKSLAMTIEARDAYTEGHCQRLAEYAEALGRSIGLEAEDLVALELGGFLHDIGKIGIPDAILLKPGPLLPDEFELMKQHTVIGERLCGELRSLARVGPIVRHHHERRDGTGYPDRLRGDAIPMLAQIISIVDLFDAVTTARPYKPALSVAYACRELVREAESGARRADLVEAFIHLVQIGAVRVTASDVQLQEPITP